MLFLKGGYFEEVKYKTRLRYFTLSFFPLEFIYFFLLSCAARRRNDARFPNLG